MYQVLAETHCHTLRSAHAYSTIGEIFSFAKKKGVELVSVTDHGPGLFDGASLWHFGNLKELPRIIDDVILLRGAEANIMDFEGNIDLPPEILRRLDLVIASMHDVVLAPEKAEAHTRCWLKIAENPYVDIIGHCGQAIYPFDYEQVIPIFKKYGKAIEINNHSFEFRGGSLENCTQIAKLCKKYNVNVVLGSDAHSAYNICNTEFTEKMLASIDFPEELILNTTADKLITWLERKKNIKIL